MSKPAESFAQLARDARELRLPAGFVLGAATAAYQIEGAPAADGKGESIWDRFVRVPGVIADASTADLACDHYRRWPEDIAVMRELGLKAYRFSLAWTRLLPDGRGIVNDRGLAFYNRLIDGLLAAGITPFVTLYHWDLPQALQDLGGWYSRDTAQAFAEYAAVAARAYGDRVKHWTTLNEPWTFCWSGHASGEDAPGLRDGVRGGLAASHHALLGHGLAVPVIRSEVKAAEVGIVLDLNVVSPASPLPGDTAAAQLFDGAQNRWFLDAVFKGGYPADILDLCAGLLPDIQAGDNRTIAAPLDYLGVNIYRRSIMAEGHELPPLNVQRINPPGDYSATRYEIWPQCLYDVLHYVHRNYQPPAIYITENGVALAGETVGNDGAVHDPVRARYLIDHLAEAARAAGDGVPVKGYFVWTLTDNFEWALGYTTPFGIVHVDFKTQQRRVKDSGRIYGLIAGGLA